MITNVVFFLLLSLPSSCTDVEFEEPKDVYCFEMIEARLFQLAMSEIECYPACDIFDDLEDGLWIEEEPK